MKVGDFVKVIDPGATYTTYNTMFKKMGFKNKIKNSVFEEGEVVQIFSIHNDGRSDFFFVGVVNESGKQSLLNSDGLQLLNFIKPNKPRVKKYTIPIMYRSCENFIVEAVNLQNAVDKAVSEFLEIPDYNYLDDSFDVDSIYLKETYPNEKFDIELTRERI